MLKQKPKNSQHTTEFESISVEIYFQCYFFSFFLVYIQCDTITHTTRLDVCISMFLAFILGLIELASPISSIFCLCTSKIVSDSYVARLLAFLSISLSSFLSIADWYSVFIVCMLFLFKPSIDIFLAKFVSNTIWTSQIPIRVIQLVVNLINSFQTNTLIVKNMSSFPMTLSLCVWN